MYEVSVLNAKDCKVTEDGNYKKTCSCVLIRGKYRVIVNSMSHWNRQELEEAIMWHNLQIGDIDFVVSTHERPDYTGNNFLFKNAIHIVGHTISKRSDYFKSPLSIGNAYHIDEEELKVIPTPGYTLTDTTVVVKTQRGTVYITGELFQNRKSMTLREDSEENIFTRRNRIEYVGSWRFFRNIIMKKADMIVTGHGGLVEINDNVRKAFFDIDNTRTDSIDYVPGVGFIS